MRERKKEGERKREEREKEERALHIKYYTSRITHQALPSKALHLKL